MKRFRSPAQRMSSYRGLAVARSRQRTYRDLERGNSILWRAYKFLVGFTALGIVLFVAFVAVLVVLILTGLV